MNTAANEKAGLLSNVSSWMTSLAGIMTAIATITTSATALLGVVAHHQAAQLQKAHAQVSAQAAQIRKLQEQAPAVTASPAAATPSPSAASDVAQGDIAHYLSNMNTTVDFAGLQSGQQVIAAHAYPNSISFGCIGGQGDQPDVAYDVAGSSTLTAELGIADNTQNATGVIATVTFSNEAGQQLGKPIQVALGHPVKVTLNIGGVTQLGMTCSGRDQHTDQPSSNFSVALGDAGVS